MPYALILWRVCVSGLTTLDLHDNCVERMPLELGQLSRLKKLNLSHNRYGTVQPVLRIRIRDPVPFWPGSGIRKRFISDPGSRIPDPKLIIWELAENFLGKKFYNSLKFVPNFFLQQFKNKIILHFVKFVATKNVWTKFFSPLSFVAVFGSGIRDLGSGIWDG